MAAVGLTYHLARRRFGIEAGVLAGLALAIMPVSVAVDRSNYADSCMVLVLLLASWALIVAVERGRLAPLLASAALVGVGFNTKMLVALGVLPAFVLVYLLGVASPWRARLWRLAAAFAVLAAVSVSWGLVVDLTPTEHRPFVGGSRDNSVSGLVLGYNGLERVLGRAPTTGASPVAGYIPGPDRAGMPGFGGRPGPLRLANQELAGQITWLIPIAAIGAVAAAALEILRRPLAPRHLSILLWAVWLGSYAVVFSFSRGIIHPYYLSVIAPPAAALFGVGASALREASGRGRGGTVALLAALILTAVWQVQSWALIRPGTIACCRSWRPVCSPPRRACWDRASWPCDGRRRRPSGGPRSRLGWLSVLLAPAVWSLMPVVVPGNPMIPVADPSLLTGTGGLAPPPMDLTEVLPLVDYLRAHSHGERYLLATSNLIVAASIVVETGEPVMATGGFLGTDPILTPARLAQMIGTGQVRFALVPIRTAAQSGGIGSRLSPGGRVINPALGGRTSYPRIRPTPTSAPPRGPTIA